VVLGFGAFSGMRGQAELRIGGVALRFVLGAREDFEVASGPFRLCHCARGVRQEKAYGHYLLTGPFVAGQGVPLEVVFKTGMSLERKFFVLDRRPDSGELAGALSRCSLPADSVLLSGVASIFGGSRNNYPEDFGPWSIGGVY
jgi:hypothetical protein